ncbi:MAG: PilZ domain-containing protein [Candidatus Alcyoniella australis]|nr:PilZ domain-containing protein [Candidatus Alcyoniella australis]
MDNEKREEQRLRLRVSRQLLAMVSYADERFAVYIQNMTEKGIGISGNRNLEIGVELGVEVNIPQNPTLQLGGVVSWSRSLPVIATHKFMMGVRLIEPPLTYIDYVAQLTKRDFERREHPRYSDILEIYSDDVLDLLEAATADVAAKGLYVRTRRMLQVGQHLEMKLCGKNLDPLYCLAEVMTSFQCDEDSLDHPFGAGVRILSFAGSNEARFLDYLKYLKHLYEFHWPDKSGSE